MGKRTVLRYDELVTPIGPLTILASGEGLCRIDFGEMRDLKSSLQRWSKRYYLCTEMVQDAAPIEEVKRQLTEYFAGERKEFTTDFHLNGTPFEKKVWKALLEKVPYGETRSYKDIAKAIQAPKAIRAVGGAINKNPLSILVPCHRIIGSNGSLVGYNGGMEKKKTLLELEKAPIDVR
ncbi:methylated-DNA--[protein]-cysteine S-methyltransferase [Aquibacillus sediminis]|uniref:methylated-DNA--[protein]-cysteine S-methyltransferase n=1 Tax=Aquibacillus sediminis TaxID=2574734 RepID=UPI001109C138|nr:methylated-DNA--[protein]-cysteine S-methyltransferase [Aquibacillus sediminis]